MIGRLRAAFAAFAVAMPLVMVAASPATAAGADVMEIQGSGVISPGLGRIPTAQSISFTGTATVVGTDGVLATYACTFSGVLLANVVGGNGTISGYCGPMQFYPCSVVWIGTTLTGVCAETSARVRWATFACVFTPTTFNPTTTWDLVCAGAYTTVP